MSESKTVVTGADLVGLALTQVGKPYRWGIEVSPADGNPPAFDCSELVEWVCRRLKVVPVMPDGAWQQYQHCLRHRTVVPPDRACRTVGALLFRLNGPQGPNHVAFSLGNGRTVEARGRGYDVGIFEARGRRWTHGALVPGVKYKEGGRDAA